MAFLGFLGITAVYAAIYACRSWRDPNNWHVDPYSKEVSFHNWAEVALSGVVSGGSAIIFLFGVTL